MLGCLSPSNQIWAHQAPVLILCVAHMTFPEGKPNRHAFFDVGLAVSNLITQATSHDIFAHQMAGFQVDLARTEFEIPEGCEPVIVLALGYYGDPKSIPEEAQQKDLKPRIRKPLQEFVFSGTWGDSLKI
jgi:hypothetical protein